MSWKSWDMKRRTGRQGGQMVVPTPLSELPKRPRTAPDIRGWRPGLRIWAMLVPHDSNGDFSLVPAVYVGDKFARRHADAGTCFVRLAAAEVAELSLHRLFVNAGDGGIECSRWNAFLREIQPSRSLYTPHRNLPAEFAA